MPSNKRAIVVGGGIAGLACAAALREHFGEVVVLEQGEPVSPDAVRRYAPQGAHFHYLVRGGLLALEELLPGFDKECSDSGMRKSDSIGDVLVYLRGAYKPRFPSGRQVYFQSRPQLEARVQERVRALPGVSLRYAERVTGVLAEQSTNQVLGVRLGEDTLAADLVIDASGRGSRFPAWFEELKFNRARVDQVNIQLGYATREYTLAGDTEPDFDLHFQVGAPERWSQGGALCRLDAAHWQITLAGYCGKHPPRDAAGFEDYLQQLPAAALADARQHLVPTTDVTTYQFKASQWRRYDLLKRPPTGFIALGDAVCSVDPKFGHGMSKALQEVVVLRDLLRAEYSALHLARVHYQRTKRYIDAPWLIAAAEAFRMHEVTGDAPQGLRLLQWYLAAMQDAASRSKAVHQATVDILALERPLESGLRLPILARVLLDKLRAITGRLGSGR
jgi:2-polyprenyl-6-methoxyphenol hydroxylase-like FAD-dependent oxidoreductase